jgi:hypothetical protein
MSSDPTLLFSKLSQPAESEADIKENAEILSIPPSEKTQVFKQDANGRFPRLEQTLHALSCKLYFSKIQKLANPPDIAQGFENATMSEFFSFGSNSLVIMESLPNEEKLNKLSDFLDKNEVSNFTYAIIRNKETGEIALSVGGSGAHAVSSMDSRVGDFWNSKREENPEKWKIFTPEIIDSFKKVRNRRFEVLAAGDIYHNSWDSTFFLDNRSGAYPDSDIDPQNPNVKQGIENTTKALALFGLETRFKPYDAEKETYVKKSSAKI